MLYVDRTGKAAAVDGGGGIGPEACRAIGWIWVVTLGQPGRCLPKAPPPTNEDARVPIPPLPRNPNVDPESGQPIRKTPAETILEDEPGVQAPPDIGDNGLGDLNPRPGRRGIGFGLGVGACLAGIAAILSEAWLNSPSQPPRAPTSTPTPNNRRYFYRTIDKAPTNAKNYTLRPMIDHGLSTFTNVDPQYVLQTLGKARLVVIPEDDPILTLMGLNWNQTLGGTGDAVLDANHWELWSATTASQSTYVDWWNTTVAPALATAASRWTVIKKV